MALAAVLALIGPQPAWAVAQLRVSPATGPAGSEVTVTGKGFAEGDVEIRWDAQSGPLLAVASGPEFSVSVVVPDSQPISHPVYAVLRTGTATSTLNTAFQVTSAEETTTTTAVTVPAAGEPSTSGSGAAGGSLPERSSSSSNSGASSDATRGSGAGDAAPIDTTSRSGTGAGAAAAPATGSTAGSANASAAGAGAGAASGGSSAGGSAGSSGGSGPGTVTPGAAVPSGPALADPAPGSAIPIPPGFPPLAAPPSTRARNPTTTAGPGGAIALGQRRTSDSSEGVRSPVLLVIGLVMALGGGAFLALRARRTPEGTTDLPIGY